MRQKRIVLISILALFLGACVKQEYTEKTSTKVWVDLYARYLDLDKLYKIEATFLRGDTLPIARSFRPDAKILFGQRDLRARQLSKDLIRYQLDYSGPYQVKETFSVKDETLQFADFELTFPQIDSFSILNGQMSKTDGGEILLASPVALKNHEELIILITDATQQSESFYIEGPFEADRIAIAPSTIASLQEGAAKLYMVRKNKGARIIKDQSLNYQVEYYSKTQDLDITP